MLSPDHRSILIDLLRPPPGMALDVAVATTFTLDLDAALVAPLAFAAFDVDGLGDPIAVLEAIRSIGDRLTVFCQAGEVRVPPKASDLFAFLEPMVHDVRRPRPGRLFHPKLWLLRYVGAEESDTALRLVVPTRNLTNDASWDCVLRLDGVIGTRRFGYNRPLVDLVDWCTTNTIHPIDPARRKQIASLVESVRRAEWDLPDDVNDIAFHALGIRGTEPPNFNGYRHLVISPFVEEQGLKKVAPSADVIVVARPDELDRLDADVLSAISCRVITSVADDVDDEHLDKPSAPALGEVHAKLIVVERARRAHLFVGSANATGAAFGGNVEVLVELQGGATRLGIDRHLDDLKSVLEEIAMTGGRETTPADELQRELDDILRDAAALPLTLTLTDSTSGGYHALLRSGSPLLATDFSGRATVELLTRPGRAVPLVPGQKLDDEFAGVQLDDITPFVVLRVELECNGLHISGGTVIRAKLVNEPPGRLDAIVARQVDSPEKFLRFLFLVLGLSDGAAPWLTPVAGMAAPGDGSAAWLLETGVFESLTRALAANPDALEHVGRCVESLRKSPEGVERLPAGFLELWDIVAAARPTHAASR